MKIETVNDAINRMAKILKLAVDAFSKIFLLCFGFICIYISYKMALYANIIPDGSGIQVWMTLVSGAFLIGGFASVISWFSMLYSKRRY